ncbi:hypothetical protein [Kitasatospora sp. NBC_01539]|uniref:hypothetical protein n=1 Tax=Kitasatospora sp. NBC_01539 TaxID=2903577 RepID=UPI0038600ABA
MALKDIQIDTAAITQALPGGDGETIAQKCRALTFHITQDQAAAPVPGTQEQQHWSKALALLGQGAQHCTDAAEGGEASAMAGAVAEMGRGLDELAALAHSSGGPIVLPG